MFNLAIELPIDEIIAYCERHPAIRKLSLFGSVLRDDFGPDSDVDVLVEYAPDASVTFLDMAQQQIELSALLGRSVDLREAEELSPYFRNKVVNKAVPLYEREG